ncbi:MAG: hypothetical protein HWE10_13605 [Gammaproteobacteria bacterium]|nr:hypothetical protein [Gammaproteobacteria bacterium]
MKINEWLASYSGCDGGNIQSSELWLSGIEWGYEKKDGQTQDEQYESVIKYHKTDTARDIEKGFTEPYSNKFAMHENINGTFGRNTAKLITAIMGQPVSEYVETSKEMGDSKIFKVNLYPAAMPATHGKYWRACGLHDVTGFETKGEYKQACKDIRFPFFREQIKQYTPKLILTTGVSYLDDFRKCFTELESSGEFESIEIKGNSDKNSYARILRWCWITDKTLFVNTPFVTGAYGLNSDYLLQTFGEKIRLLLSDKAI